MAKTEKPRYSVRTYRTRGCFPEFYIFDNTAKRRFRTAGWFYDRASADVRCAELNGGF